MKKSFNLVEVFRFENLVRVNYENILVFQSNSLGQFM